ncbi:hypothetical protein FJY71_08150 [candidate division WOR-3 bacterium]|nr:hypothetical protein [candidate division WOR-3 bacterium]
MATFKHEKQTLPCPRCGYVTDREFRFCQSCGAPLPFANAYVEPKVEVRFEPRPKRSTLAIASLILGIAAAFPLGLLAGIPAILLGTLAVRRRVVGMGMGLAGIILGLVGTFVTTPAMVVPRLLRAGEGDRRERLSTVMLSLQAAVESWADSAGTFPDDPPELDATPAWVPADLPANPYTRHPYEYGTDLFCFPDRLRRPGIGRIQQALNLSCPYSRLGAPESVPGTIVLLGHTDVETGVVSEYAIAGFGRDVTRPVWNLVEIEGEVKKEKVFFVLTGELALPAPGGTAPGALPPAEPAP